MNTTLLIVTAMLAVVALVSIALYIPHSRRRDAELIAAGLSTGLTPLEVIGSLAFLSLAITAIGHAIIASISILAA